MIAALTVVLLVVLAAIFTWRVNLGLYALIFAMPFEWIGSWALNPHTGHPVTNLAQVVAAAWAIAIVLNVIIGKVKLRNPVWPWRWLAAFVVWAAISAAHVGHIQLFESFVIVALLFVATTAVAMTWKEAPLERVVDSLMASATIVSLFGVYQFIMGTFRNLHWAFLRAPYIRDLFGFPRIHSVTLEPLYFANYLLIPLFIGLVILVTSPKHFRLWHRCALSLVGLDFLLTMSRGAILAAIPALLLLVWALSRTHLAKLAWNKVALGAAAILVVVILAIGAASYVATRDAAAGLRNFGAQLTVKLFSTGSFYSREAQSSLGLQIASSHWLFGVGLGGVTFFVNGYATPRHPNDVIALNNQAVELLAETGVIGTALFYIFLLSLFWLAWRAYPLLGNQLERGLLLGSLVAVVAMTIQAQSFTGFFLMPYWVLYGFVLALAGEKRRKSHA